MDQSDKVEVEVATIEELQRARDSMHYYLTRVVSARDLAKSMQEIFGKAQTVDGNLAYAFAHKLEELIAP